MSIIHNDHSTNRFNVYEIYSHKSELVNSIAQEAIRAMTETYIEMVLEEKLDNRIAILEKLQGVNVSAIDYMDCVMNDLHNIIKERMEKQDIKFSVLSIMFNDDGDLEDVDVKIKVCERA